MKKLRFGFDIADINWEQFEEMCFDLLEICGFRHLKWLTGPGDKGRDIEGFYYNENPLLKSLEEKWVFECKHSKKSKGINIDKLYTKIAWADARQLDHLVIITNSTLTNPTREWIAQIQPYKKYRIHSIEQKQLMGLLKKYPEIVHKYFFQKQNQLLDSIIYSWEQFNILPSPEMLIKLSNSIDLKRLTRDNLIFIWCISKCVDFDEWEDEFNEIENISEINSRLFDFLIPHIKESDTKIILFGDKLLELQPQNGKIFGWIGGVYSQLKGKDEKNRVIYCREFHESEEYVIEAAINKNGSRTTCRFRKIGWEKDH